jgi:hypothetical protein
MSQAYQPETWQNLYVMLGSSSAALAGLLFIAVSLQISAIAKNRILRVRAWANTFLIIMLVVNAAIILAPQSISALGSQLCFTGFISTSFFVWRAIQVKREGIAIPKRAFIATSISLIGILGGVSLISRFGGGMYIVTVQSIAILLWVMFNAWSLLLSAYAEAEGPKT